MIAANALEPLKEDITKGYPFGRTLYWDYTENFEDSDLLVNQIDRYRTDDTLNFTYFIDFSAFLALYSFYRMAYCFTVKEAMDKGKLELSRANYYAYMAFHIGAQGYKYLHTTTSATAFSIDMQRISPLLSATILANDWHHAELLTRDFIDSLNAKSCIIGRGNSKSVVAWFVIKLLSAFFDIPIEKRKPRHPARGFELYEKVLKNYDTDDLREVEKLVNLLADKHLEKLNLSLEDEEEIHSTFLQIIPYEIIAWLKIRTKMGLENPADFMHPLMKQPFMAELINSNETLPRPEKLPYAEDLLSSLKASYEGLEIPRWVNKDAVVKETINQGSQSLIESKTAPKTGRYRATLPKDHPQSEALKTDPQAYRTYKAGERFFNAGLEEYETDKIEWEFVE